MKVYALSNCDTCRKALAYLRSTGRDFELKAIRETPPTKVELRKMLKIYDGKLSYLFNTSGQEYRAMKLGPKLKTMDPEKAITLLASNGSLVKRPFVVAGNTGMVGFHLDEWMDKGIRPMPKV
jgi:arsenate reductase